jgi:hypothetical protein
LCAGMTTEIIGRFFPRSFKIASGVKTFIRCLGCAVFRAPEER